VARRRRQRRVAAPTDAATTEAPAAPAIAFLCVATFSEASCCTCLERLEVCLLGCKARAAVLVPEEGNEANASIINDV